GGGRELPAERLPAVPRGAVPEAVPELAVREDREDFQLVDAPRRYPRSPDRRPAERFRRLPRALDERRVQEIPIRPDPEAVDPALAPRNRGDPRRSWHAQ